MSLKKKGFGKVVWETLKRRVGKVGAEGARTRSLRESKILAGDFGRFRKLLSEPLKTSSILPSYSKIYLPKFYKVKFG